MTMSRFERRLKEKEVLIRQWYAEGKIKRLGPGCYSVTSQAFVSGITPRLIREVLEPEENGEEKAEL